MRKQTSRTTHVLSQPLTLHQAQCAAALDDLLFHASICSKEGVGWGDSPKRMRAMSFGEDWKGVVEASPNNTTPKGLVNRIRERFLKRRVDDVPVPILEALHTEWHKRLLDVGWFVPSLEPTSTSNPRHPEAGLRAVFRSTPKGIEFEDEEDHKAIGLGFVVVQLPDMPYDQLLRSGFSPESLVRTTREGRWKLVLGPGALLRRACTCCFWITAYDDFYPAFTSCGWIVDEIEGDREVFMLGGTDAVRIPSMSLTPFVGAARQTFRKDDT
ncbi:hypothetical protein JCM24511_07656 [Saitozyma sp. JCM 24511]|nr:hypothetical protein JCM24511_07656 [Saitozyma sp. JCM 24511]